MRQFQCNVIMVGIITVRCSSFMSVPPWAQDPPGAPAPETPKNPQEPVKAEKRIHTSSVDMAVVVRPEDVTPTRNQEKTETPEPGPVRVDRTLQFPRAIPAAGHSHIAQTPVHKLQQSRKEDEQINLQSKYHERKKKKPNTKLETRRKK